jgi:hypothetical protein
MRSNEAMIELGAFISICCGVTASLALCQFTPYANTPNVRGMSVCIFDEWDQTLFHIPFRGNRIYRRHFLGEQSRMYNNTFRQTPTTSADVPWVHVECKQGKVGRNMPRRLKQTYEQVILLIYTWISTANKSITGM